jgi:hypothetical protein
MAGISPGLASLQLKTSVLAMIIETGQCSGAAPWLRAVGVAASRCALGR